MDKSLIDFVGGPWAEKVQSILVRVLGEEIALVTVRQFLKGHGSRIDEGVEQIEPFFIHEPGELVHHALVANGGKVDEGGTIDGLKIAPPFVKVHMRGHIVGLKGHVVQIRSLKLKSCHLGIDGSLFHQESLRGKLRPFKMERPTPCHLWFGQLQFPFQIHLFSKELKGIDRCGPNVKSLAVGMQAKIRHVRPHQWNLARLGHVVVGRRAAVSGIRHKRVVVSHHA